MSTPVTVKPRNDLHAYLAFLPFTLIGTLIGFIWRPLDHALGVGPTLAIAIVLGLAACISTGILLLRTDGNH